MVIEEIFKPSYFCSRCGDNYDDIEDCPKCGDKLFVTSIYRVKRICNTCDKEFEATLDYFEDNPKCPDCKEYLELLPINDTHSFVFDGKWNGKPLGKMVRDRNEQLKKKNEGYSYETPSTLSEKVTKQHADRNSRGL